MPSGSKPLVIRDIDSDIEDERKQAGTGYIKNRMLF